MSSATDAVWLGHTPTGQQLTTMPIDWFHQAIDSSTPTPSPSPTGPKSSPAAKPKHGTPDDTPTRAHDGHQGGWSVTCTNTPERGTAMGRSPGHVRGRPTKYNGVQMRSRLEADFAQRVLDADTLFRHAWEYEPGCFASSSGQYLPDFGIRDQDFGHIWLYWEIKPFFGEPKLDDAKRIDELLARMSIIWESEPSVALALMFWKFGGGEHCLFMAGGMDRIWMVTPPDQRGPLTIWPGMGQLDALRGRR